MRFWYMVRHPMAENTPIVITVPTVQPFLYILEGFQMQASLVF